MHSRWLVGLLLVVMLWVVTATGVMAARGSWQQVVDRVEALLAEAERVYATGQAQQAKDLVNEAYFGPFEGEGMETAIRLNIASRQAAEVELTFSQVKQLMIRGAPRAAVGQVVNELVAMLRQDAIQLDGSSGGSAWGSLAASLLIVLREGFEAILVLGAIIAYLVKSGNQHRVRVIYRSALLALLASGLTAILLQSVFRISGASQEALEGFTMLLATVVLFGVSFWLISKAKADKWQRYISGMVQQSLGSGSSLALGLAAFLAVYREGAETVLFYQALVAGASNQELTMIFLGLAIGMILLAAVFLVVRYGSLRLPLRPFFLVTGALMYYLAFTFAGGGVKELQEAGLVSSSPVAGGLMIDWLGIYPTWETLAPQLALVAVVIVGVLYSLRRRPVQ